MAARDTQTRKRRATDRVPASSGRARNGTVEIKKKDLQELLDALRAARDGEAGVRLAPQKSGVMGDVAKAFNSLAERREGLTNELNRVSRVIGREGRMTERAQLKNVKGSWSESISAVNSMSRFNPPRGASVTALSHASVAAPAIMTHGAWRPKM